MASGGETKAPFLSAPPFFQTTQVQNLQFALSPLNFPAVQPALTNGTYTTPMHHHSNPNNSFLAPSNFPDYNNHSNGTNSFPSPANMQPARFAVPQNSIPHFGTVTHAPTPGPQYDTHPGWNYPMSSTNAYHPHAGFPMLPMNLVPSQPSMQAPNVGGNPANISSGSTDSIIQYLLEEQCCLWEQLNQRVATSHGHNFGKSKYSCHDQWNTTPHINTPLSKNTHQCNVAPTIREYSRHCRHQSQSWSHSPTREPAPKWLKSQTGYDSDEPTWDKKKLNPKTEQGLSVQSAATHLIVAGKYYLPSSLPMVILCSQWPQTHGGSFQSQLGGSPSEHCCAFG